MCIFIYMYVMANNIDTLGKYDQKINLHCYHFLRFQKVLSKRVPLIVANVY